MFSTTGKIVFRVPCPCRACEVLRVNIASGECVWFACLAAACAALAPRCPAGASFIFLFFMCFISILFLSIFHILYMSFFLHLAAAMCFGVVPLASGLDLPTSFLAIWLVL